jgi:hypothetical protein
LSIEHLPFFISIAAARCIPAVPPSRAMKDGKRSMLNAQCAHLANAAKVDFRTTSFEMSVVSI